MVYTFKKKSLFIFPLNVDDGRLRQFVSSLNHYRALKKYMVTFYLRLCTLMT